MFYKTSLPSPSLDLFTAGHLRTPNRDPPQHKLQGCDQDHLSDSKEMQACQPSFALVEKTMYNPSDEPEDYQSDCESAEQEMQEIENGYVLSTVNCK